MTTRTIEEKAVEFLNNYSRMPVRSYPYQPLVLFAEQELAALRTQVETLTAERDAANSARDDWKAVAATCIATEREACAKVCEANAAKQHYGDPLFDAHMADAHDIRARGKL